MNITPVCFHSEAERVTFHSFTSLSIICFSIDADSADSLSFSIPSVSTQTVVGIMNSMTALLDTDSFDEQ